MLENTIFIGPVQLKLSDELLIKPDDINPETFFERFVLGGESIHFNGKKEIQLPKKKKGFSLSSKPKADSTNESTGYSVHLPQKEKKITQQFVDLFLEQLRIRSRHISFKLVCTLVSVQKSDDNQWPVLSFPVHVLIDLNSSVPFKLSIEDNPAILNDHVFEELDKEGFKVPDIPEQWTIETLRDFTENCSIQLKDTDLQLSLIPNIQSIELNSKNVETESKSAFEPLKLDSKEFLTEVKELSFAIKPNGPADFALKNVLKENSRVVFQSENWNASIRSLINALLPFISSHQIRITGSRNGYLNDALNISNNLHEHIWPAFKNKHAHESLSWLKEQLVDHLSETRSFPYPDFTSLAKLNRYDKALHGELRDSGWSLAALFNQLIGNHETPHFPVDHPKPLAVNESELNRLTQFTKQIVKLRSNLPDDSLWFDIKLKYTEKDNIEWLRTTVSDLEKKLEVLRKTHDDFQKMTGIHPKATFIQLRKIADHFKFLQKQPLIDSIQFNAKWYPAPTNIQSLISLIEKASAAVRNVSYEFDKQILQEPLESLIPQFDSWMESSFKFIKSDFRSHSKRMLGYYKGEKMKFDRRFMSKLYRVLEAKQLAGKVKKQNELGEKYFGRYWDGIDSDTELLQEQYHFLIQFGKRLKTETEVDKDQFIKVLKSGKREKISEYLKSIEELNGTLRDTVNELYEFLAYPEPLQGFEAKEISKIQTYIEQINGNMSHLSGYLMYQKMTLSPLYEFVSTFIEHPEAKSLEAGKAADIFRINMIRELIEAGKKEHPAVTEFETADIRMLASKFWSESKAFLNEQPERLQQHFMQHTKQGSVKQRIKKSGDFIKKLSETELLAKPKLAFEKVSDFPRYRFPLWILRYDQWPTLCQNQHQGKTSDAESVTNKESSVELILHLGIPDKQWLDWIESHHPTAKIFILSDGPGDILPSASDLAKPFKGFELHHTPVKKSEIRQTELDLEKSTAPDELLELILRNGDTEENGATTALIITENQNSRRGIIQKLLKNKEDYTNEAIQLNSIYPVNTTLCEEQSVPTYLKSQTTIIDTAFKPERINPFLLKKQSPREQKLWARSVLNTESKDILFLRDIHYRKDETQKLFKQIETEYKLQLTVSYLNVEEAYAKHITYSPTHRLESIVDTDQGDDLLYVWSDYIENEHETLIDHLCDIHSSGDENVFLRLEKFAVGSSTWLEEVDHFIKQGELLHPNQTKSKPVQSEQNGENGGPDEQNDSTDSKHTPQRSRFEDPEIPENPKFESIEDQPRSIKPKLNKLPRIKQYEPFNILQLGNQDDFYQAGKRIIFKTMTEIVQKESPVHWHYATRSLAQCWNIDRVNDTILILAKNYIRELVEEEQIFIREGILYDNPDFKFAIRSREAVADSFLAWEIPLPECEMALYLVLEQYYPVKEDALLSAATHLLGYEEDNTSVRNQLEKALKKLAEEDQVGKGKYGLQLVNPVLLF